MFELRHYQAGSTPAITSYLVANNNKKNPIVALPTGAGKSLCIADFILFAIKKNRTVLMLSHVQEILEQNAETVRSYVGIEPSLYSASLGLRQIGDVTIAGIQSVHRQADLFNGFDYIIIDECHRVSYDENSMYRKFLSTCSCPVIGFTATPFRLGSGKIHGRGDEHIFDDIVHDWTHREKFVQLINEGYLSPIITEGTDYKMDTSDIKHTASDFNISDLAVKFDRDVVTDVILEEIKTKAASRKQWLLFAIDIKHADNIAEKLNRDGIPTIVVHSKMGEYGFDRAKIISSIKEFNYRCIVNVDTLTTGFDHPAIDFIGVIRPTESPVLHVQIVGRGSRIFNEKDDCLVLDFAGNFERLGPINDVYIKIKGKGKGGGDPIMKKCPKCSLMVHAAARVCSRCSFEFPREHGLAISSSKSIAIEEGKPIWLNVDSAHYDIKITPGRPSIFVASYICGNKTIRDMVCLEHRGYARDKAIHWFKVRGIPNAASLKVIDLLALSESLKVPSRIRVEKKNNYLNITEAVLR
jgi:DNA repair protein RadD